MVELRKRLGVLGVETRAEPLERRAWCPTGFGLHDLVQQLLARGCSRLATESSTLAIACTQIA